MAFIILPVSLFCQPKWGLIKNKNGIKIYTASSGNSNLKLVKATITTKGTISKALQIFRDVERQPQWVYSAKKAYIVRKASDNNFLYYVESSLPWPVSDRYLLAWMKIDVSEDDRVLSISTIGDAKEDILTQRKIRIKYFIGKWEILAIDNENIHIEYNLDIDPGGNLPSSIVNLFISKGPYKSLKQLAELLKQE